MLISQHPGLLQGSFPLITNAADFLCDIEVVDDDADEAIDIVDADITAKVVDGGGATILTATTDNGKITLSDTGVFRISFSDAEMATVCPGTYRIGVMLELDGTKYQLILADFPVIEGIGP